jgi:redox-sensitive bicupin YhaK (pirin superfamily)
MSIKEIVEPRSIEIDGFPVLRSLPRRGIRSVGPWVFFDHMGPHSFKAGEGMDVPPHPHINLATVTYLFEGKITHRDSEGNIQDIEPGAINLMVAGRGIAHSERSPERDKESKIEGLQLWHALPESYEETEPDFYHYPAEAIPVIHKDGVDIRVMIGEAFSASSPVLSFCSTLYAELEFVQTKSIALPEDIQEQALYCLKGEASVAGAKLPQNRLVLLERDRAHKIQAGAGTKIVIIGGEPLGKRFMWWNFVSSRKERIEKAMSDWKSNTFKEVVDDSGPSVPLPETDGFSFMK